MMFSVRVLVVVGHPQSTTLSFPRDDRGKREKLDPSLWSGFAQLRLLSGQLEPEPVSIRHRWSIYPGLVSAFQLETILPCGDQALTVDASRAEQVSKSGPNGGDQQ
jgi:hypothetical protein